MSKEKCSTKWCGGKIYLYLKGKPLCEKCWNAHCDIEETQEAIEERKNDDIELDKLDIVEVEPSTFIVYNEEE